MPRGSEARRPEEQFVYEPEKKKLTVIKRGKEERRMPPPPSAEALARAREKEITPPPTPEAKRQAEAAAMEPKMSFIMTREEFESRAKGMDRNQREAFESSVAIVEGSVEGAAIDAPTAVETKPAKGVSSEKIISEVEETEQARDARFDGVMQNIRELRDRGVIKHHEATAMMRDAAERHLEGDIETGRTSLGEAKREVIAREESAKKVEGLFDKRAEQAVAQGVKLVGARIDMAHAAKELPFSSKQYFDTHQYRNDASKQIKEQYGVDVDKPGIWNKIKIFTKKAFNREGFGVMYKSYNKAGEEFDQMSDQIEQNIPNILQGKTFDQLREAGKIKPVEKRPEPAPRGTYIEAIKTQVEADVLTPELGTQMIAVERKRLDDEAKRVQEVEEAITRRKETHRKLNDLHGKGELSFSGDEYYETRTDLEEARKRFNELNFVPKAERTGLYEILKDQLVREGKRTQRRINEMEREIVRKFNDEKFLKKNRDILETAA
jgi:hypothetical protein